MRIFVLAFTLTFTGLSYAQDCNYEIDEKDEFTGEFLKMVEETFPHGRLEFTNDNGAYSMQLFYSNPNLTAELQAKGGDEIMIKLANEEIITLTCLDVSPSGKEKKPTMYDSPTYELTEEQITALGESEMTMVRIDFDGESVDVDPSKNAGKIMEGAQCIML